MMPAVRNQYERYPYPPVHWAALPRKDQGAKLAYEFGAKLAGDSQASHQGKRILVAGAGTLEALVVAQQHPEAQEIVAVDVSAASLSLLRRRLQLGKIRAWCAGGFLPGRGLPKMSLVQADLREFEPGSFDYIIASNILHHVEDPAALLQRMASWLKPGGLFRMMVYPKYSRFWLRQTASWLQLHGLHPQQKDIRKQALAAIQSLPLQHPVRSSFEHNSDATSDTGIVDAYLHACENPLSMMQWCEAAQASGLERVGEAHALLSQSSFLEELVPALSMLDPWRKLEILDLLLEVCANPIVWFRRKEDHQKIIRSESADPPCADLEMPPVVSPGNFLCLDQSVSVENFLQQSSRSFCLPSRIHWQLGQQCRRAEQLLPQSSVPAQIQLSQLLQRLQEEVGSRCAPLPSECELPGLSITDYDYPMLRSIPQPWDHRQWDALQAKMPHGSSLFYQGWVWSAGSLAQQAEYLQIVVGATQPWLEGVEICTGGILL